MAVIGVPLMPRGKDLLKLGAIHSGPPDTKIVGHTETREVF